MDPGPSRLDLEAVRARRQFDNLFSAHVRAVYAYARRRVDAGDVDDVVAETFTVAWRRLSSIPDPPLPYLLGIARKVIGNRRRSQRRRGALVDRLGFQLGMSGAPLMEIDALAAHDAVRVLARLPELERETLLLIAWDGLSPDHAALVLGCTRNAVDLRLFHARRRIVALLAEGESEQPRAGQATIEEVHP